jgi:alanyl-tRNA synthetase
MHILDEALRRARDAGVELPAQVAFELHDTYGFPFDLTREIAQERDMKVDEDRFAELMSRQRERARAAHKAGEAGSGPGEVEEFQRDTAALTTAFVGYERLEVFTVIRALRELADGRLALKLAESPFYPEGGGQSADTGWIHTESGKIEVEDVVRFEGDQVVLGRPSEGAPAVGERAKAMVNAVRRHQTACNHTATHLLHNALRLVLGEHVRQAGSSVRPDKLRFDYTTRQAPTPEELRRIEELVNRRIVENHPVRPFVTTKEYALEIGALAFFEEKYGDFVRVLEIDDFSRELCGGTHVATTSQIGLFKIVVSQSVGANTRRIEAITSAKASEYYHGLEDTLNDMAAELGVSAERVTAAWRKQSARVRELEERLKTAASGEQRGELDSLLAGARDMGGVMVVAGSPKVAAADELLALVDQVRERAPESLVVMASEVGGRAAVVVAAADAVVGRGVHAPDILRAMTPAIDGKGGGKPTLARGGGDGVEGIAAALEAGLAKAGELLGV